MLNWIILCMLYSINYGICTTHTCTCTLTYITVHSIIVLIVHSIMMHGLVHRNWELICFSMIPFHHQAILINHVSVDNCHKPLESQLSCIHVHVHTIHGHTQFIYTD